MTTPNSDLEAPQQYLLDRLADTESRLASLKEQLTESQRLATIGTIAAVIAPFVYFMDRDAVPAAAADTVLAPPPSVTIRSR